MRSTNPFALWRWESLLENSSDIGAGFIRTLQVAVLALLLALVIGVVVGTMSTAKGRLPRAVARIYVEMFQNIPLVIQIFFMYNGLAMAGLVLSEFTIGVVGVGMYHGAYIAEVVRAGILAVPKGQEEAAYSEGFNYIQTMRYVILPQMVKIILPPLTNQAVNLIKNTSVLAIIAGADLMYVADSYASYSLNYGPAYAVAGLLYFLLCFPLATFARKYEQKLKDNDTVVVNVGVDIPEVME
ncbi:MAG TPA: amino acid ABC transporter permease [Trichococcus sp.]|jgi:putative glutamine transport system permease protein|uniref:amino acid ABC transporter permease n=1 Tax=Trichococcus TaxID=82802 RepID=UPI0007A87A2A|nr:MULTISPECIES: amino acid ABC transporter permease [Trichococcus]MBP9977368.1 amino acid ABC transporter permease [Trichococcus sp.]CZQ82869.1 amino acid abc transporter permease protein 3-tm domain [Trichococcus sp. ES5]SHF17783.1 putative glutamine transport system permease protein [Trichococcus flocculiformis]HAZ59377.1 amino acid ABC transporter permease [Trichococcus sp.]HQZ20401.1 amino acid ABC transporter permease [Trichococcus flocculiformis]